MYLKIAQRARTRQEDGTSVIGGITSAVTYECSAASFSMLCGDDISGAVARWIINDDTPIMIYKEDEVQTDIYLMNNNGKTIEHYVY